MNYYTTKEISEILGLSIKTIQKLIRTKQLKAFKIGNRFIVEESTLKDYINAITSMQDKFRLNKDYLQFL